MLWHVVFDAPPNFWIAYISRKLCVSYDLRVTIRLCSLCWTRFALQDQIGTRSSLHQLWINSVTLMKLRLEPILEQFVWSLVRVWFFMSSVNIFDSTCVCNLMLCGRLQITNHNCLVTWRGRLRKCWRLALVQALISSIMLVKLMSKFLVWIPIERWKSMLRRRQRPLACHLQILNSYMQ